jgi:hypothetical protein
MRRDYYVYMHRDTLGAIFYVGKGTGRRAWSTVRHPIWHKYVSHHLDGKFSVEIFRSDLTESEAESIEWQLIEEHGRNLVNWINPGRDFDYAAIENYHCQRNANREYVEQTRVLESMDLNSAVQRYRFALQRMRQYEGIILERGLIADLGGGPDWGDPNILNRLTLCLQRLGRHNEVVLETEAYFSDFPSARTMSLGKKISARADRCRASIQAHDA